MGSFSPFFSSCFAQEYNSKLFELHIPEKMIEGYPYHGMITLFTPSSKDTLFVLESNNDFVLESDVSVLVQANQNHGIFNITPNNEGQAEITATFNGELSSAISVIYSEKSTPQKLQVVLPGNSTVTDELSGYVFLLDGNGFPIQSEFDRVISLVTSEKIIAPRQVTILNGSTNSGFDVTVRATGDITATGIGLISGTSTINKVQEKIDVKMAIAPNIALEESYVNYFIWLEKNGRPYNVPNILKVELQSSNTNVVRLGISPSSYKNVNSVMISMSDGMASGRLYTGEKGVSEIFASVQNYGHASSLVSVGPAILVDGNIIDEEIESGRASLEPNYILFDIFPDVTDDISYGVASVYYSESAESLDVSIDEDGTQVTNLVEHTTLIPVKTEDLLISISSEYGLEYDSDYLLDGIQFPTHSKIFEITANNVGEYSVTATGAKSSDTANLSVKTTQNSQYSIQIVALPISSGLTQPLMMITIVDEDGNIVDVSESFGSSLNLNLNTIDAKITTSKLHLIDNVKSVSGIVNGHSTIDVSSDIFGSHLKQLTPSGIPISVEFLIPDIVHNGEPFPIAIHEVDAGGIPISKKQTELISSSGFAKIDEGIISVNGDGQQQISILGKLGGAFQTFVESFTNKIDFDISSDTQNARIGEKVIIKIDSPINDVEYGIDSPFPYEKIDEKTFSVVPNYEVTDAQIAITGKLDGFSTLTKQLTMSSENIVEISVNAETLDGKIISPTYDIHLGNKVESTVAPAKHLIKPQQIILEFPENYSTVAGGYRLIDLKVDGTVTTGNIVDLFADVDHTITAVYDKFVQIIIHDGKGSGIYPYGEMIKISAPDKPKLSFLIVEKFDHWIGSDKPATFVVNGQEDVEITAVYKEDYSGLMIVIVLGVTCILILVYRKGDSRIRYHLHEIHDFISLKLKISIPKIDLSKMKK